MKNGYSLIRGGELPATDITHIQADGSYSILYFSSGKSQTTCRNLKYWAQTFKHVQFMRCHHRYMVNCSFISNFDPSEMTITIAGKIRIPVSRRRRYTIRRILQS
jgi:two-component system, LytTR family, response regulator